MERRGLGKGLGALIPGAEKPDEASGMELDVDRIGLSPYQPRESVDEGKLQELVESIRVHGVLQPIVVRSKGGGRYELVAGERRLRAATAAGLKTIPAVVRALTDQQSLEVALIENLQREDINPVDAAVAYRRLLEDFGLTQEDIAFGLSKSRSAVANTLRLLQLPEEIREHVKSGRISEGHARAILSMEGEGRQLELCRKILLAGLSVREAERLAKQWSSKATPADVSRETPAYRDDPNVADIEARLREIFGTKVTLAKYQDRGRIVIEFYSEDELDRIIQLLTGG